jgi:hypothetical protein
VTTLVAGPDWASVMTATGTVALAAVTVAAIITTIIITKQDRQRADKQLADEQARHDREIAEERAHSAAQLREERERAHDAEQRGEAYAVVITPAKIPVKMADPDGAAEPSDDEVCPVAVVVNNGRFTITNLDARFGMGTAIYPARQMEYYSGYPALPQELVSGLVADAAISILPPGVAGIRFIGGAMTARDLHGVNPIVRWTDRWGTRWEHKRGKARPVDDSAPWQP